jgi:hypothetical protein
VLKQLNLVPFCSDTFYSHDTHGSLVMVELDVHDVVAKV